MGDASVWLEDSAKGGYMRHVNDIVATLRDGDLLRSAGMTLDLSCAGAAVQVEDEISEDELADIMWAFCMNLTAQRVRRGCWLICSWPTRFFGCLNASMPTAAAIVGEFKRDYEIWKQLEAMSGKGRILNEVYERHCMRKVSNEQLVYGLQSTNWELPGPSCDFLELIRRRSHIIGGSSLCEELIGSMKNTRSIANHTLYRRPEASFHAALRSKAIEKRHRYDGVTPDRPLEARTLRLPATAFRAKREGRSFDFGHIASTRPSPGWWSPSVPKMNCPVGDLYMLREAATTSLFAAETARLGGIAQASHKVVLRRKSGSGARSSRDLTPDATWYYALFHFPSSCISVWPCSMRTASSGSVTFFELSEGLKEPIFMSIFSLGDFEAFKVTPRSWLWQLRHCPISFRAAMPGVRIFAEGAPMPLLHVAAKAAFWELPHSFLKQLAKNEGWQIDSTDSLLETLFLCVRSALGCSDAVAMDICAIRLGQHDLDDLWASSVLEIDEGLEVLAKDDHERVDNKQKDIVNREAGRKAYVQDYAKKRQSISGAKTQSRARKASGGGGAHIHTHPLAPSVRRCRWPPSRHTGSSL